MRVLSGKFERIGLDNATLTVTDADKHTEQNAVNAPNHAACLKLLLVVLAHSASEDRKSVV